jgi:hypothetical protein
VIVSLIYESGAQGQAGTHVLAIGIGDYPHLLGGSKTLANKPLGLKQLQSPVVSLKAVLDWIFAPIITPGAIGFVNSAAPLASVEALGSAPAPITVITPEGPHELDRATRQNIQDAFEAWLARTQGLADNVGVFYFCGHGVMVSDHYLLAEDFGQSNAQPWAQAFNISTTLRAVEREIPGAIFCFIDACRQIARDLAMTLGANPSALLAADLNKKVVRKSMTLVQATGEGDLAFAPPGGQVSRFTSALLAAISGYCGIKSPGEATWNVDGESISTAVRQLLEFETLNEVPKLNAGRQVSEQAIHGHSVPLVRRAQAPSVKVWLDLSPSQRRALYELYLQSAKGHRVAQTCVDQVFTVELPRGFYEVGALDPAGTLPSVVHQEEELVPPMYALTLQSQP